MVVYIEITEKNIGEKVKLKVRMHIYPTPVMKEVVVKAIYPRYILFDTGKYKFCGMKSDILADNPIQVF